MKRKYVIGGVVICAAAAGWFGMYTVENTTEAAVAEALSSLPAQAREIRYSFLNNTLTLKGVEYSFTDTGLRRRGSIESVEVKGFNRRYVFTMSDEPYSPDALPIVAESITAAGITDTTSFDRSQVEQKVDKLQMSGWYQRLGTLMTQRREHMGEVSFFEELYRCRIDKLEADNVTMKLSEPDMSPVNISVDKIALTDGVRAPRVGEKVAPFSLGFFGMRFSGDDCSGELQKLELRDVLAPEPEVLAEFFRACSRLDAADEEERYGSSGDKLVADLFLTIRKNYEHKVPVGRVLLENGMVSLTDEPADGNEKPSVFSMAMKKFDYILSMTGNGAFKNATELSGLKFTFPDGMEEADILSRYAPHGLVLNASSESLTSDTEASGKLRYELEGLGILEGDMAVLGDLSRLQNFFLNENPDDLDNLMQNLRLKSMNLVYRDSGLLPMSMEIAARWNGWTMDETLNIVSESLHEVARIPERPVRELGTVLLEQFDRPGEFRMTIAPEKPMNFTEAAMLASLNPDTLPVTFGSKPGTKTLREYLPKN